MRRFNEIKNPKGQYQKQQEDSKMIKQGEIPKKKTQRKKVKFNEKTTVCVFEEGSKSEGFSQNIIEEIFK